MKTKQLSCTYLTDQFCCSSGSTELVPLVWPPTQMWNHQLSGSGSQTPPAGTLHLQYKSRWCCQEELQSSGSPAFKKPTITTAPNLPINYTCARSPWGKECLCWCSQRPAAGGQPGREPGEAAHYHNLRHPPFQKDAWGLSAGYEPRWGFPRSFEWNVTLSFHTEVEKQKCGFIINIIYNADANALRYIL